MRRSLMISPRLYQVKLGRTQPARPALLLDTDFWDYMPDGESFTISPAGQGAQSSHFLDSATRARRGLPVLQVRPGAPVDRKAQRHLRKLLGQAKQFPDAASRVLEMRQEARGVMVMNVVPTEYVICPVDRPTIKYRCPGTEDVKCGTKVSPAASSRLRSHDTPAGRRCQRSNTKLTDEEREAGLVRT